MDDISLLSIIQKKYVELGKEIYHKAYHLDGVRILKRRLNMIETILCDARNQLEESIGLVALKKDVLNDLKYGLCRLEYLAKEITLSELQGSNNNYVETLAKEVVKDLDWCQDREGETLCDVSEVYAGRTSEREEIIDLLLLEETKVSPVSIVPVLGLAGTGKTTLIRFVYCDITFHFDIKLWVDISGVYSSREILREVFRQGDKHHRTDFSEDLLSSMLKNKKYLLVLDNLSHKDGRNWVDLLKPLLSLSANCEVGSKILVTSRKPLPDHIYELPMANDAPYNFRPLHPLYMKYLFQQQTRRGIKESESPDMKNIHDQIFSKCGNNLHVSKIIASMLSSERTLEKWQYINDILLTSVENPVESIQAALDLMQRHNAYRSPLLTYFLLFPVDYEFSKVELRQLWEAQQKNIDSRLLKASIDEIFVNEYFLECGKRDKPRVLVYYKKEQVLMHEVMKHLARDDYCLLDEPTKYVNHDTIQHISFVVYSSWEVPLWLHRAKQLKSLLFLPSKSCGFVTIHNLDKTLANLKTLQVLDLAIVSCGSCLNSVGELKHLRYLRLGSTSEVLPECITNLLFLQTLDLQHSRIRELPRGFHKLAKLRHLYTGANLIDLPPRFEKISKLQTLDVFIAGQNNGLGALARLTNLAGKLTVRYQEGREKHVLPTRSTFLKHMNLFDLSLAWSSCIGDPVGKEDQMRDDIMKFELLQPPFTLKNLTVQGWEGVRFPHWAMDHRFSTLLKELVCVNMSNCSRCQYLPSFRSLVSLESLQISGLHSLEWIEIYDDSDYWSSATSFPRLKYLMLSDLPQLKGWSKAEEEEKHGDYQYVPWPFLDCLSKIKMSGCPKLISMPLMPRLQSLEASNVNKNLLQHHLSAQAPPGFPILESICSLKLTNMTLAEPLLRGFDSLTTLEELSLCWLHNTRMLPESIGHLTQLQRLVIRYMPHLARLPESIGHIPALKHVEIRHCPVLKQLPKSFPKLLSLQRLVIKECIKLKKRCHQPDGEDWPLIKHIPYRDLD